MYSYREKNLKQMPCARYCSIFSDAKVNKTDRLLSLMAPMFWFITYVTRLTCLKVRFFIYEVRVNITHRARMEFK